MAYVFVISAMKSGIKFSNLEVILLLDKIFYSSLDY